MDVLLLAITTASLLVALVMSAAAWRLARADRSRSAARVAALTAAVQPDPPQDWVVPNLVDFTEATGRLIRPTVPTQAASHVLAEAPAAPIVEVQDDLKPPPGRNEFLGSIVAPPPSGGRQRGLALAAAFLFVALVAGGYWTIFGENSGAVVAADRPSDAAPLELVSLRHERQGTRLAITGLVRNPAAGTRVEQLSAVVFLFDQQGNFVTSARADADFRRLGPGDESPFVVTVEAPNTVARYRVSFRNDAGVVGHIDRRGQEPIARELR